MKHCRHNDGTSCQVISSQTEPHPTASSED
jgi:hypothetical protein